MCVRRRGLAADVVRPRLDGRRPVECHHSLLPAATSDQSFPREPSRSTHTWCLSYTRAIPIPPSIQRLFAVSWTHAKTIQRLFAVSWTHALSRKRAAAGAPPTPKQPSRPSPRQRKGRVRSVYTAAGPAPRRPGPQAAKPMVGIWTVTRPAMRSMSFWPAGVIRRPPLGPAAQGAAGGGRDGSGMPVGWGAGAGSRAGVVGPRAAARPPRP
jgi:hypothetical protein